MYVVIAGGGVLGGSLARRLVENRHDVVVIERDQAVCEFVSSRIGALAIHGVATDIEVLEEAGIERADVAVGALPTDADNLSFIVLARNFEVPRIMARMRAPRYKAAYKIAGATTCINVGEFFVNQLVLEIEQPTLHQVATFGNGKAAIVVATIPNRDGDPAVVCVVGSSFGGYTALVSAYKFADRIKCAVSLAGISDLESMVRRIYNFDLGQRSRGMIKPRTRPSTRTPPPARNQSRALRSARSRFCCCRRWFSALSWA